MELRQCERARPGPPRLRADDGARADRVQDRRTDGSSIGRSPSSTAQRLTEPSAMALSLTALCLRIYGLPADDVEDGSSTTHRAERLGNLQGSR